MAQIEIENGEIKFNETSEISASDLWYDNHSREANKLRKRWLTNRLNRKLVVYSTCADSRIYPGPPTETIQVSSIATGLNKSPLEPLILNPGNQFILVVNHYDGEAFISSEKTRPDGCGGLSVKQSQLAESQTALKGVSRYVQRNVTHFDPVFQSLITAANYVEMTDKPVYAAVQDHINGTMSIVGRFNNGLKLPEEISEGIAYGNPDLMYVGKLIPGLNPEYFDPELSSFLNNYNKHLSYLHRKYPELRTTQRRQNPNLLIMSTDQRNVQIKLPEIADVPGSVFRLHIPRSPKFRQSYVRVNTDTEMWEDAIAQAEYPFSHFSNMQALYIETDRLDKSIDMLHELMDTAYMQKWLKRTGRSVVLGEVHGGEIKDIEQAYRNGRWNPLLNM